MATLKRKITVRKGHRNHVETLLKHLQETTDVIKLKTIEKSLIEKHAILKKLDDEILEATELDEDLEKEIIEASQFSDELQNALILVNTLITPISTSSPNHSLNTSVTENKFSPRLPKLQIKHFNGNPHEWKGFWDQFNSSIHLSTSISNVDKFIYLKSLLEDTALETISELCLSETNYERAIKLLEERFNNPQILISSYMQTLATLPKVSSMTNVKELRDLYNKIQNSVTSLKDYKVETNTYGSLLIGLIFDRIPEELKIQISRAFENNVWNIEKLLEVFKNELMIRETCSAITANGNQEDSDIFTMKSFHLQTKKKDFQITCAFCNQKHSSSNCNNVTDINKRKELLKENNRCFICLRKNHIARECKSSYKCNKCNQRHNISICDSLNKLSEKKTFLTKRQNDNVLLQSAVAQVSNATDYESSTNCRVLFDACSQRTYVTDRLKSALNLKVIRKEKVVIQKFASDQGEIEELDVVQICLRGKTKNMNYYIEALSIPLICSPLEDHNVYEIQTQFTHLKHLNLSELPQEENLSDIDILIGLDFYYSLITGKIQRGLPNEPVAVESVFGWIICGPTHKRQNSPNTSTHYTTTFTMRFDTKRISNETLHNDLTKFWEIESFGTNQEDNHVSKMLIENLHFDGSKYVAKLPFKNESDWLPDNYKLSLNRLHSLKHRLSNDEALLKEYNEIFKNYLKENIIEEVHNTGKPGRTSYLPHHPVIKMKRETTKIRIVFDASARFKGPSVNDLLHKGPCLLNQIYDILIRFRTKPVALIGDIEKAFLNIKVAESDQDTLRFLWYKNSPDGHEELITYRFLRLVFGLSSSPFILNATIDHHMRKYETINKEFVINFLNDLYVDDYSASFNNNEQAYDYFKFITTCLNDAGFHMRKWCLNSNDLMQLISNKKDTKTISSTKTVLGTLWDITKDEFIFSFKDIVNLYHSLPHTKRSLLSVGASFYDPMGLLSPITIFPRTLFQQICTEKFAWDNVLSDELKNTWSVWINKLAETDDIRISRQFLKTPSTNDNEFEVHGFCDSSRTSYAAVCYIRAFDRTLNIYETRLVTAKSKVAPLKQLSIPRLELQGCLLLSTLITNILATLQTVYAITKIYCWSDSLVALHWIKNTEKIRDQWVENRVKKIRNNVPVEAWFHIPTNLNPADIPTRNVEPTTLHSNKLWWNGPEFLTTDKGEWSKFSIHETIPYVKNDNINENKIITNANLTKNNFTINLITLINIENYSTLIRLLIVTTYVNRFIFNLRNKQRRFGKISAEEIQQSLFQWVHSEQSAIMHQPIFKQHEHSLQLFKNNDENVYRVKHRINREYNRTQYPIYLPFTHLAKLLIIDAHKKVGHLGINSTLTELRSKYWISRGRQRVKQTIKNCLRCKLEHRKPLVGPPPPSLPSFRTNCSFAFEYTGLDYAGPLHVKQIYNNNQETFKAYICLFTCATTRSIHLELTPHMDAPSLIRCLMRFRARRGNVQMFISDNFKTFKSDLVTDYLTANNITWKFILPASPWWGGFYERLVKVVKQSLHKIIGNSKLSYEEVETVLIQIECIINSRPLTFISNDSIDEPLTPSHLLVGRRLLSPIPKSQESTKCEANFELTHDQCTNRMKFIQNLINHYWLRFQQEYLTELAEQQRYNQRRYKKNEPLKVNDIALIKDKGLLPRNQWKRGRIVKLIQSDDNQIRGAILEVCTNGTKGQIRRPIQKLIPLEIEVKQSNETRNEELVLLKQNKDTNETNNINNTNEITHDKGKTETELNTKYLRPRRKAAINADAITKLMNKDMN